MPKLTERLPPLKFLESLDSFRYYMGELYYNEKTREYTVYGYEIRENTPIFEESGMDMIPLILHAMYLLYMADHGYEI